jgi:hypothetical protein
VVPYSHTILHNSFTTIYMLVKLQLYMDETKTILRVVGVEKADRRKVAAGQMDGENVCSFFL